MRTSLRTSLAGMLSYEIRKIGGEIVRNWLIQLRKDSGLTQTEVAAKASISQNYYSCIEKYDRNPTISVAKRIAAVLGFDWVQLYESGE